MTGNRCRNYNKLHIQAFPAGMTCFWSLRATTISANVVLFKYFWLLFFSLSLPFMASSHSIKYYIKPERNPITGLVIASFFAHRRAGELKYFWYICINIQFLLCTTWWQHAATLKKFNGAAPSAPDVLTAEIFFSNMSHPVLMKFTLLLSAAKTLGLQKTLIISPFS